MVTPAKKKALETTAIEWTVTIGPDGKTWPGFTFNPWEGCQEVSPGCKNCYAKDRNRHWHPVKKIRKGKLVVVGGKHWGKKAPRRMTSEAAWKKPLKWNRDALAAGVRFKVFCASIADVFEDRPDLVAPRARLFALIEATPGLDWLFVTKRPENMVAMAPASWAKSWPVNVWAGCTVENQEMAEQRIPHLIRVPAAIRFLSMEPLLEAVDLDPPTCPTCGGHDSIAGTDGATPFCREHGDEMAFGAWLDPCADAKQAGISWIIVGGESGAQAKVRPFDVEWARSLVKQAREAGIAPFVKQFGAHVVDSTETSSWPTGSRAVERLDEVGARIIQQGWRYRLRDGHGGDMAEWPEDIRIRAFPASPAALARIP